MNIHIHIDSFLKFCERKSLALTRNCAHAVITGPAAVNPPDRVTHAVARDNVAWKTWGSGQSRTLIYFLLIVTAYLGEEPIYYL